jgi:hypothetical protein
MKILLPFFLLCFSFTSAAQSDYDQYLRLNFDHIDSMLIIELESSRYQKGVELTYKLLKP